jgi:hypothetical protein
MYAEVISVFNASRSITETSVFPDGIATVKLLYVDPVFKLNGFDPLVNILSLKALTALDVVGAIADAPYQIMFEKLTVFDDPFVVVF